MATNCLGPFLLNHLLEPILTRTAQAESASNRVRIVWVSSIINVSTPPGGIQFDKTSGAPKVLNNAMQNYMQTKVGNVFLASEAAKRLGRDGIISVVSCVPAIDHVCRRLIIEQSVNPGLMKTKLQRNSPKMQSIIMVCLTLPNLWQRHFAPGAFLLLSYVLTNLSLQGILFKPPVFGAYTELFAALSPSVTAKHNGGFIVPWGRFGDIPDHIEKGLRTKAEGGSGAASRFWEWCQKETENYC